MLTDDKKWIKIKKSKGENLGKLFWEKKSNWMDGQTEGGMNEWMNGGREGDSQFETCDNFQKLYGSCLWKNKNG